MYYKFVGMLGIRHFLSNTGFYFLLSGSGHGDILAGNDVEKTCFFCFYEQIRGFIPI